MRKEYFAPLTSAQQLSLEHYFLSGSFTTPQNEEIVEDEYEW